MTTKTKTRTKKAQVEVVEAVQAVKSEVAHLTDDFIRLNKEANAAAAKATKARKELFIKLKEQGLSAAEGELGAVDLFAKESFVIDPAKLSQLVTPEVFWQIVSVTKEKAKHYVAEAQLDLISSLVVSTENVHICKEWI